MQSGCSIRALWILNNQDTVVFSRKFPMVERRWLVACEKESEDNFKYNPLPCESEIAAAFIDRKKRFIFRGRCLLQYPLVGTPLDLSYSNISSIKAAGFSSADLPPADRKQPAWKPYLYRGTQRILFTIHETVHASMYDRDEIPDSIIISGQVNCRADLEGLPDVSFPLTGLDASHIESLSFLHGAQVPEHGGDKQAVTFSPPLGNFTLVSYQAFCSFGSPIKWFYQLSMVSENEGAFLFKLSLVEGYKAPLTIVFCTVIMPFPKERWFRDLVYHYEAAHLRMCFSMYKFPD